MRYVGLEPAAPNCLADESHSHFRGRPPRHPQKKGWGGCTSQAEDLDRLHGHESEDVDERLVTRDWNESTSYVIHTNQFSKTQLYRNRGRTGGPPESEIDERLYVTNVQGSITLVC